MIYSLCDNSKIIFGRQADKKVYMAHTDVIFKKQIKTDQSEPVFLMSLWLGPSQLIIPVTEESTDYYDD